MSKHGVNFIDTAEMYPVAFDYGKTTEAWIGDWLEARVASGEVKREDLYFATKVNPNGVGGTVGPPWEKHGFPFFSVCGLDDFLPFYFVPGGHDHPASLGCKPAYEPAADPSAPSCHDGDFAFKVEIHALLLGPVAPKWVDGIQ